MLIRLISFQIDIKQCFGNCKVSNKIHGFITTASLLTLASDTADLLHRMVAFFAPLGVFCFCVLFEEDTQPEKDTSALQQPVGTCF